MPARILERGSDADEGLLFSDFDRTEQLTADEIKSLRHKARVMADISPNVGRASAPPPFERTSSSGSYPRDSQPEGRNMKSEGKEYVGRDGMRQRGAKSSRMENGNGSGAGAGNGGLGFDDADSSRSRIPMAPPSNPVIDDDEWHRQVQEENSFKGWHYLPLIFAIVPPLGAMIHGRSEGWTDALMLVIIGFYLFQIVRVPWELYYAARTRRILQSASAEETTDPELARRRRAAMTELQFTELVSLAMTVLSPFAGAYLLYFARATLSDPDHYVNPFSIRLFVLASGIRPWAHFLSLVKSRSLFLQEEVHYPSTEVQRMKKKVDRLEAELSSLRRAFVTKSDIRTLREGLDVPLNQLSKAVRKYERKEEYLRLSSEERFALMEARLEDTMREISINAELLDRMKSEQEQVTPLTTILRIFNHILGQPGGPSGTIGNLRWYERGPFFYVFLPLNITNLALTYAGKGANTLTKALGAPQRGGMIAHGDEQEE